MPKSSKERVQEDMANNPLWQENKSRMVLEVGAAMLAAKASKGASDPVALTEVIIGLVYAGFRIGVTTGKEAILNDFVETAYPPRGETSQ